MGVEVVDKLMTDLREAMLPKGWGMVGCSSVEIESMQRQLGVVLPRTYVRFLEFAGKKAGQLLHGSDFLYDELIDLQEAASELLAENNQPRLQNDAFVFAMHQGYSFLFFLTSEGDDPAVRRYVEGGSFETVTSHYTEWLKLAIEEAMDEFL